MYGHKFRKSMDQPGKVANPVRCHLNRENEYLPVPVRAWEFGLARRVRQSRPASACSSPSSGWIWCLLMDSSRVYQVTQLRTDGVHCRESTGTGPVNLKVVPNGSCLGRSPWTNSYTPLFSHTHYWYEVGMLKVPAICYPDSRFESGWNWDHDGYFYKNDGEFFDLEKQSWVEKRRRGSIFRDVQYCTSFIKRNLYPQCDKWWQCIV